MDRDVRVRAWWVPLVLLIVAVVAVPVRVFDPRGLPRYRALKNQLRVIEKDNATLRQSLEELTRDVVALRSDPVAIERIAHDELGLVRADEVIVQFAK